ncbi:MAG: hypothetical protein RLZZ450_7423 [Pseudomonadota bacterium]|jgi:hypothetical protein
MYSRVAISMALLFASSCAPQLSPAAQTIRVADQQMVKDCTLLSDVQGTSSGGFRTPSGKMESSKIKALNKAAELGATHVLWDTVAGGNYSASAHGMAYACR